MEVKKLKMEGMKFSKMKLLEQHSVFTLVFDCFSITLTRITFAGVTAFILYISVYIQVMPKLHFCS